MILSIIEDRKSQQVPWLHFWVRHLTGYLHLYVAEVVKTVEVIICSLTTTTTKYNNVALLSMYILFYRHFIHDKYSLIMVVNSIKFYLALSLSSQKLF